MDIITVATLTISEKFDEIIQKEIYRRELREANQSIAVSYREAK